MLTARLAEAAGAETSFDRLVGSAEALSAANFDPVVDCHWSHCRQSCRREMIALPLAIASCLQVQDEGLTVHEHF